MYRRTIVGPLAADPAEILEVPPAGAVRCDSSSDGDARLVDVLSSGGRSGPWWAIVEAQPPAFILSAQVVARLLRVADVECFLVELDVGARTDMVNGEARHRVRVSAARVHRGGTREPIDVDFDMDEFPHGELGESLLNGTSFIIDILDPGGSTSNRRERLVTALRAAAEGLPGHLLGFVQQAIRSGSWSVAREGPRWLVRTADAGGARMLLFVDGDELALLRASGLPAPDSDASE